MRGWCRGAGVVVALVLLGALLVPAPAGAADESFTGTYTGYGKGTNNKGKSATSALTIWVEDLGDTVRLTLRVNRAGITVDTECVEQRQGDTVVLPIDVSKTGAKVKGTVTLEPDGENWILMASGSGKLLSYKGRGEATAIRVATGVSVPGVGEQIGDLFSAAFGGPPDPGPAPKVSESGGKLKPPDPPATVEQVQPMSTFAVAEATPPVPEEDKWYAAIAIAAICFIMFGFFIFI